jgi:PKD repeat protein
MFLAPPALAQYMFLDANGDGVNNDQDTLEPGGTATLDIWLDTAKNRDGSPATCDVDPSKPLSTNSWEVVLHAVGGTIDWGPCQNLLDISPSRVCFASGSDTTDPVWYHNGWGGYYILQQGLYHLARLQVRAVIGNPAIVLEPYNPSQPTDLTSFGTQCDAKDGDNTYKLGLDWHDVDGIGGRIIFADAGGPYRGIAAYPIQFDGSGSRSSSGGQLTYQWDFGDGSSDGGSTPSHTYMSTGTFTVTLTVNDGSQSFTNWTTATVLNQTPPVADPGGPYDGVMEFPVLLDGRRSSDVNGDPLTYAWTFGDGMHDTGAYVYHTYHAPGTYAVTLTVGDGYFATTASTEVHIREKAEQVPIADAGGPYQGYVGVPLQLDGTRSYDLDGDPLTYWWVFGDGSVGAGAKPTHTYADVGDFEVILEVGDGTLRTSSATTASIGQPTGRPPVARPGGPYHGLPSVPIAFDGTGSTDPDGDALTFAWDFGDQAQGSGAQTAHAYASTGQYTATLTVSDGIYHVDGSTPVSVTSTEGTEPARAFLHGGNQSVAVGVDAIVIQMEPMGGSFRLEDVDLNAFALRCPGNAVAIRPVGRPHLGGDEDGNGIDELVLAFREVDVQSLLKSIQHPAPVALTLDGVVRQWGAIRATLPVQVLPAGSSSTTIVRPNPFNPQATATFVTTRAGTVRVEIFNIGGRLVKTIVRDQIMDAGSHDIVISARGDQGAMLSSGIYFLRIIGPDGPVTTRITIAK